MIAGERVAAVAPAARSALRTVARSLAAPQALVATGGGAGGDGGGSVDVNDGGDVCVMDGVVVLVICADVDVDVGVNSVGVRVRVFVTRAVSIMCLSLADRLFHKVGKGPPWPLPFCVAIAVGGVGVDDEVIGVAAAAFVFAAFVVFPGDDGVMDCRGAARVAQAHSALGSSPGPCMRAHDPTYIDENVKLGVHCRKK